ncbi:MAG: hypothetical protein ACTHK3_08135 [Solirubrobacterales bacterium]
MGESRPSIELRVIELIEEAFKSREEWEAIRPDLSPLDDDWVMLQNWASTVHQQGLVLAHLAMLPQTRAELIEKMTGLTNRAPAWLDAHFQGQRAMTLELFLHGIAQTMAKQRAAIARVVDEQVGNAEAIEETLAKAPVPLGTEERSSLIRSVGKAMTAHSKALVDMAYDLEVQLGWHSEQT